MRPAAIDFIQCFAASFCNRIQLSPYQAQVIGSAIRSRAPGCRLLIFGLGHDSDLWLALNADGETHFVESSTEWIKQAVERRPGLSVSQFDGHDLTVANSTELSIGDLERYPIPPEIADGQWDVIVVDGPRGYRPEDPGRALPIYWASRMAVSGTHVFVDDYERPLEQKYADALLRGRRGAASYVIQASDETQHRKLFWSAGSPVAKGDGLPVVLVLATKDYAARWRFCIDSQRTYCRKNGYEHHVLTTIEGDLHPKWAKLASATQLLEQGTDVLLIDADAEITSACPPVAQVLAEHSEDIFYVQGSSGRPNSGVLILRGGQGSAALAFLRECLARKDEQVPKEDFVTAEGENGHVIWLLKSPAYAARAREMEKAWNCSDPQHASSAYIRHYTNRLRDWRNGQVNDQQKKAAAQRGVLARLRSNVSRLVR